MVHLCRAKEIDHIVISPGSRNAPLIIGFTAQPSFECFSIVDERCAGFFALGLAQQLKKPVALICTSGSALLNYYPAIAEAFYSEIPLIVLSADRPKHLIDIGDGQTIRQEDVFKNHILYSANLIEGDQFQAANEFEINYALNTSIEQNGPVHINVPFSEPLYDRTTESQVVPANKELLNPNEWSESLDTFQKLWNSCARKMILIGSLPPNSIESEQIQDWVDDSSVLVFTETTSNLHHSKFIPAIDQLITSLSEEEFSQLQPDVLLTFGGMIVSKRIKAFLRKYQPKKHWHVGLHSANNTFFCLTHHFKTTPNEFLRRFIPETHKRQSDYQAFWLNKKAYRLYHHEHFVAKAPYSDFSVYEKVFDKIPNKYHLHLANSAAVRYAQLFDQNPTLEVFCNRGTSGIDGSSSTAIGSSVASKKPTLLITGDLSFFYDSNALWNTYVPLNFRIILINNGGGGIFRILPKAKEVDKFENYFETRHQLNARNLCLMYNWKYECAHDQTTLIEKLSTFYDPTDQPALLEVFTPSEENDKVLKAYFKAIE